MRYRTLEYSTCLFVAMVCAGCGTRSDAQADASRAGGETATAVTQPETSESQAAGQSAAGSSAEAGQALAMSPVDYAGLLELIEGERGRPVVLDVWSTSCDPCIKELPNLARLHADYQDRVACVSLNIDYTGAAGTTPVEARERALPVLEALGIRVHNLYSTTPDRELFKQDLFQENSIYAIPAILVFDQSGEVVGTFGEASDGESPYMAVREQVESVLTDG